MKRIINHINPATVALCKKAIALNKLRKVIDHYLPTPLSAHCEVANYDKGQLTLIVDSPIWSNQLRYLLPELRNSLRTKASLYDLSGIKILIKQQLGPTSNSRHDRIVTTETPNKHSCQSNHEPIDKRLKDLVKMLKKKS